MLDKLDAEFAFGRDIHPLWIARFALGVLLCGFVMLLLLGISTPLARTLLALQDHLGLGIERGEWLVEQHDRRLDRERAR